MLLKTPPSWEFLVNHSRYVAPIADEDWDSVELTDDWLTAAELTEKRARIQKQREKAQVDLQPSHPKPESEIPEVRVEEPPVQGEPLIQREQATEPPIVETVPVPEPVPVEPVREEEPPIQEEVVQSPKRVRFTRETKPPAPKI